MNYSYNIYFGWKKIKEEYSVQHVLQQHLGVVMATLAIAIVITLAIATIVYIVKKLEWSEDGLHGIN